MIIRGARPCVCVCVCVGGGGGGGGGGVGIFPLENFENLGAICCILTF